MLNFSMICLMFGSVVGSAVVGGVVVACSWVAHSSTEDKAPQI